MLDEETKWYLIPPKHGSFNRSLHCYNYLLIPGQKIFKDLGKKQLIDKRHLRWHGHISTEIVEDELISLSSTEDDNVWLGSDGWLGDTFF
jgi:hypothetical protein